MLFKLRALFIFTLFCSILTLNNLVAVAKIEEKIAALLVEQELCEFDAERLAAITGELADMNLEKSRREEEWLAATLLLEG